MMLDVIDQQLLNRLQAPMPLVPRPFEAMGRELDMGEEQVLQRVARLKRPGEAPAHGGVATKRGLIRQISAIFDSKSLGYQSTLVAARIDEDKLDSAAAIINRHPGVSHNYRRNHAFNLWYTLAVPPDSALGLEKTLAILHHLSGAHSTRMLPTLRLFKIGVRFDMTGGTGDKPAPRPVEAATGEDESSVDVPALDTNENQKSKIKNAPASLTATDKDLIRVLQQDLPIVAEPFAVWAREAGVSVERLLEAAQEFLDRGLMRRFSAVLRHREAGISANAMGVWAVPPEQVEAFGARAAGFASVSHCYLRSSYPDWPFTMFTMVHAPTKERCEAVLAEIAAATGIKEYSALYSTKEYKKVRVKYFTPEVSAWERDNH